MTFGLSGERTFWADLKSNHEVYPGRRIKSVLNAAKDFNNNYKILN